MSTHRSVDEKQAFFAEQQKVLVKDEFNAQDLILDLGGGGKGVIGQLRGRQVVAIDLRREEFEECASGPIKVVADAKALQFLDNAFDAITAFYFLMVVPQSDRETVLSEAFRVLRPGGRFHIWDAAIPAQGTAPQELFVVPVVASLPDRTIQTGYGVRWEQGTMTAADISQLAQKVGFSVCSIDSTPQQFKLNLRRPA